MSDIETHEILAVVKTELQYLKQYLQNIEKRVEQLEKLYRMAIFAVGTAIAGLLFELLRVLLTK